MEETTRITIKEADNISIIEIEGDVAASDGDAFDQAYKDATQKKILLSFRENDHINSGGIAVLIDLVAAAQKDDIKVSIAHPRPHFRKVFDLVGLAEFVDIFESKEKALEMF